MGLVDANVDEKEAKEIISDFSKLSPEKRLNRVKRLDDTVAYAQTKYVHVYELLKHIFSVLVFEAKLIEKLNSCSNEKDFGELVAKFKSELQIEQEAISQIQNLNTFGVLFSSLVRAEHIVKVLTSKEKRYLYHMEKRMKAIFGNNVESGITLDWMGYVYQEVGKRIEDLAAQQILSSSTHADFEYVNRPEFVALVHEVISGLREDQTHKKAISAEMEAAFVHLFREWFNHERN
jgi:hypothetical protein